MPGIVKISFGQVYSSSLGYIFPSGQEIRVGRDWDDPHNFNVMITSKNGAWDIWPIVGEDGKTLVFDDRNKALAHAKATFDWFIAHPELLPAVQRD